MQQQTLWYLPTRFRPANQDEDVKAFCGYPRHLRYHEVLMSDGVEYLLRKYNAFWIIHSYISLTESKTTGRRIAGLPVLTHEVISAPDMESYRYVITDSETILYSRTYEQDGLMGNGFIIYMVADPGRSKGFFMLPTEYDAFRRFSSDYPDLNEIL